MPWLAAVGSVVGGVASGLIGAGAQDRATQAGADAAANALQWQKDQYAQTRADQAPYRQAGQTALTGLNSMMTDANYKPVGYNPVSTIKDPGQFQFNTNGPNADPSYTWRVNQGLNAINSSAAAKGGYFSGGTGEALNDYGQEAASQEYGNQFNRWQTTFNDYMNQEGFNVDQFNQAYQRMYGVANLGEGAVTNTGVAGQQFATNSGNIAIGQGNNASNAEINKGNVWGNVVANATNQFSSAWPDIWKQISKPTNAPAGG